MKLIRVLTVYQFTIKTLYKHWSKNQTYFSLCYPSILRYQSTECHSNRSLYWWTLCTDTLTCITSNQNALWTKTSSISYSPNSLTAQEAGTYSNTELTNLWNSVLFTKHSDTTLKLLGKAISFDFLATCKQHPTDFYSVPVEICLTLTMF